MQLTLSNHALERSQQRSILDLGLFTALVDRRIFLGDNRALVSISQKKAAALQKTGAFAADALRRLAKTYAVIDLRTGKVITLVKTSAGFRGGRSGWGTPKQKARRRARLATRHG